MSDFDKLLAALMAGGANVNVTVLTVHAGGVVNIKNGCVEVEKSGAPNPKKARGEKKSESIEPVDDDHTSAADQGVGGSDEPQETPAATERNDRGGSSPQEAETKDDSQIDQAINAVKLKLLALSDELTNGIVNHVDRLSELPLEELVKILAVEDAELDSLDELLNRFFPNLAY